jgi:hypothetical protein
MVSDGFLDDENEHDEERTQMESTANNHFEIRAKFGKLDAPYSSPQSPWPAVPTALVDLCCSPRSRRRPRTRPSTQPGFDGHPFWKACGKVRCVHRRIFQPKICQTREMAASKVMIVALVLGLTVPTASDAGVREICTCDGRPSPQLYLRQAKSAPFATEPENCLAVL